MNEPSSLTLKEIRDEAGNIKTFVFETGGLEWTAGQYQTYALPHDGVEASHDNEHWFTISSAPSEGTVNISTRLTGSAFKSALAALQPGDTLSRYGIEGDFTWEDVSDERVVFVAAGIGVTPFRSILLERHLTDKPLNSTLLYFNRDDQIPFKETFDDLVARHPEFTVTYVTGQPVTADKILELAPEAASETTYLSGPGPMVIAVGEELSGRGVTVKRDEFPGYTEQNY